MAGSDPDFQTLALDSCWSLISPAFAYSSSSCDPTTRNKPATKPRQVVSFVSLGCPKALVDSERIITRLRAEGYALTREHKGADMVIVNTCGFLDSAQAESLDAIGDALAENGKVIVTGCMGAEPEKITERYPQRARDHRAAAIRERARRRASRRAAAARSRSSIWCRRRASS